MRTKLLLIPLLLITGVVWGQNNDFNISFKKTKIEVERKVKEDLIIPITVEVKIENKADFENYVLNIETVDEKSTLPKSDYKIAFDKTDFKNLKDSLTVFLVVDKDSLFDRERNIVLRLTTEKIGSDDTQKPNKGANQELSILVKSSHSTLKEYKYLSYIGTNFDLVEGVKADNFFFATNIFSQPTPDTKDFGVYLSLYGNRTMSTTDDLGVQQIITEIVPVTETSSYRLRKHVNATRTIKADNLGAHFSTLHPIFGARNKAANKLKTYVTGSAEFIWQRKHILTEYGEVTQVDTLSTASTGHSIILNDLETKTISVSQYQFNIGPGMFFSLEDENISVRVHMSVGYTSTFFNISKKEDQLLYDRKHDVYFSGRAWITEPKTGVTLQAEVMNRFIDPTPMYVVTLSKAFNLDRLAGFFQPITSR